MSKFIDDSRSNGFLHGKFAIILSASNSLLRAIVRKPHFQRLMAITISNSTQWLALMVLLC
jgi:hypothetical protein